MCTGAGEVYILIFAACNFAQTQATKLSESDNNKSKKQTILKSNLSEMSEYLPICLKG